MHNIPSSMSNIVNRKASNKRIPNPRESTTHKKRQGSFSDLTVLIPEQKWDEVERILSNLNQLSYCPTNEQESPNHATLLSRNGPSVNIHKHNIVHFAVACNAPLKVLHLLSVVYNVSLTATDASGRYPIHVAAKWGATPAIIEYLIRSNPSAASSQDCHGKTPMHYVGECYARHYQQNNAKGASQPEAQRCMYQVVRLLKAVAPESLNIEDSKGMNAIEYALENESDMNVIKAMQRASRDDWRKRKESSTSMNARTQGMRAPTPRTRSARMA